MNPILRMSSSAVGRACSALTTVAFLLMSSIALPYTIDTAASPSPITGLWWNPNEPGWGTSFIQQYDVFFVTMFTYDAEGNPIWYVASNCAVAGAGCQGDLHKVTGGSMPTVTWNGSNRVVTPVGKIALNFTDNDNGSMTYSIDGYQVSKTITREVWRTAPAVIKGLVIGAGLIESALVCADQNANGKCDENEVQTRTDAGGQYQLTIPNGAAVALVAEVIGGTSRDSTESGATVDASYRLVSPSSNYSTNITPYTTLVRLSTEADSPLAEDETRNTLGLPPRFDIKLSSAPAAGSLTQAVAKSVAAALKVTGMALELSTPAALDRVIAAFPRTLTDLPLLRINTKAAAPIVSKETYVDATYLLTNAAIPDQVAILSGKIRGRGNATWGQPKNPYKIVLKDDASYGKISDVVGMKKSRYWVLLADYFDKSLMRNKLALSLANSSVFLDGLKWNSSGQHLEVYLNDEYVGVYLLTEDIRIDPSRLNIKTMSPAPAVNDLDGGYIVEVDRRLDCDVSLQHITQQGLTVCIDTPDESAITPNQLSYINAFIDEVELDLYGSNKLDKIDPVSFADWYLINEFFRNNDAAFFSSDFMWKDTNAASNPRDRLLNMGPIWDFDISAGNTNLFDNYKTDGCWVNQWNTGSNWLHKMSDNSEFVQLTISRWKQKRGALEKFINSSIDTYSRRLDQAQQRNYAKWQTMGVPLANSYYVFSTYADEVAFLKRFLNERLLWLDKAYANPDSFNALCK